MSIKKYTLLGLCAALWGGMGAGLWVSPLKALETNPHGWVGLGLGVDHHHHTFKTGWDYLFQGFLPIPVSSYSLKGNALSGLVKGGFGLNFNGKWHTGLELTAGNSPFKGILTEPSQEMTFKSGFFGGGALRLGFKHNSLLVFTKFGATARKFSVFYQIRQAAAPNTPVTVLSSKYTSTAFTPGVGLEYYLSKKLKVGLEGAVELHPSKAYPLNSTPQLATIWGSHTEITTGLLSLSYTF